MSLQVDYQEFRRAYKAGGTNTILELSVDEGKEKFNVLIHDMNFDPVTDVIRHVDLINVRMGQKLTTKIPLEFVGTAPAVKELGGVLVYHLNEVEIECLPKDLIHSVEVNIESLADFHTYIRIKDLSFPETIAVLHEEEDVVINAVAPREEEVDEPVVAEGEELAEGEEAAEGAEAAEGGEKSEA